MMIGGSPERMGSRSRSASPAGGRRGSTASQEAVAQDVVSKARGLLEQLRTKARRGSETERLACEALARECAAKLDEMEKKLSRQASPRTSPRTSRSPGAGSPARSRSPAGISPRSGAALSAARLRLAGMQDAPFTPWAWVKQALGNILSEIAPFLVVVAVTAMLARAYDANHCMVAVGVYCAILSITQFLCGLIYNGLLTAMLANVTTAAGAGAWGVVGKRIWSALLAALVSGGVCAALLMLGETPIFDALLLTKSARVVASPYWFVRSATVPVILANRVLAGLMGGFNGTWLLRIFTFVSAAFEITLTGLFFFMDWGLAGAGFASLFVISFFTVVSFLLLPYMAPAEARGRVSLWADLPCCSCLCRKAVQNARMSRNQPLLYDMGEPQAPGFAFWPFFRTNLDTIARYTCLQGSLVAAVVCASRFGENVLAAHHFAGLVWMVSSYFVDGFSDVGTRSASRLLASRNFKSLKALCTRLALAGLFVGVVFGVASWFLRDILILGLYGAGVSKITEDRIITIWPLVCAMQVVNAAVYTYDGLMIASAQFAYVRNVLLFGVICIFAPALAAGFGLAGTLLGIWGALAVLNVWRCVTSVVRIHFCMWPRWNEPSVGMFV